MTESMRNRLRAIPVFEHLDSPATAPADLPADPLQALGEWIFHAAAAGQPHPHAMTLVTVDSQGSPSARTLICKDIDQERLYFASRSDSRKGLEIAQNPRVAAQFYWPRVGRQIRITGTATPADPSDSQTDFAERGRGSQLAAHLHGTTAPINRQQVLDTHNRLVQTYPDRVPYPPQWTLYAIEPTSMEFWQASPDRVHHRVLYSRNGNAWTRQLLWP